MSSSVRILGAFVDTLYLNAYPTVAKYQPVAQKLPDELEGIKEG